MHKKIGFVMVGLVALPLLFGCVVAKSEESQASSSQSQASVSTPSAETSQKTSQGPAQKTTEVTVPADSAPDVSEKLPYKGMPASVIDQTWLGPSDEVGEELDGGACKGGVSYYWHARNGTGDLVFIAYVKDDEVISVAKLNLGKNYWGDGSSVLANELPDLDASGETVNSGGSSGTVKPDPDAWDDAEDYANANFSSFGSWDEAHDYWLEEMS